MYAYPIETDNIIVSFSGVKVNREATRITRRVWKFSAKCDGREANEDGGLLTSAFEEVCLARAYNISLIV